MKIANTYKPQFLLFLSLVFLGSTNSLLLAQKSPLDENLMKGKKILIVYGGWEGHKPLEFVQKITPWLEEEGAEITLSDSLGVYMDSELLMSQDLIIQSWTGGTITKDQCNGLLTAIKNGVGFTGCHAGIGDSFRDADENNPYWDKVGYYHMVGGIWVAHPGNTIDYTINITKKDDDIMVGLKDFNVHTEQYYMHIDPNVNVLATTTYSGDHVSWIEGAIMPVAWKKYFYEGRIFYYSVGHHIEDYDVPETWKIVQRGFRWASESKYKPKEEWLSPVYQYVKY